MTIEITYPDGQSYTSYQPIYEGATPIIFTFTFTGEPQPREFHIIESTAQALPLTQEVQS